MEYSIKTPLSKEEASKLKAGDIVKISGKIYAARDAAHKKIIEFIDAGKRLPFDFREQIIYYVGPCPAKDGQVVGSAGPTTSGRMDAYAPKLIELGLTGMIGKGARNSLVIDAMKRYKAVYFGATGGAGALISKSIVSQKVIAFPELGPEALRELEVKDFCVTVVIDSFGDNLYKIGRNLYKK